MSKQVANSSGFIVHFPFKYLPLDISTLQDGTLQTIAQLSATRYSRFPKAGIAYLDQGLRFFTDAIESDWRSAGLLYYYSFLNLGKAYLVKSRAITSNELTGTKLSHGLSADPQGLDDISDFELKIHPANAGNNRSVFTSLYHRITSNRWPFQQTIILRLRDLFAYSSEISVELEALFNISCNSFPVISLVRTSNVGVWYEMFTGVRTHSLTIQSSVKNWTLSLQTDVNQSDKIVWFNASRLLPTHLGHGGILRSKVIPARTGTRDNVAHLAQLAQTRLRSYAVPRIIPDPIVKTWRFIPFMSINQTNIRWHPLLSDYLVSFVLGSILRYQTHLITTGNKNQFIAEAWCGQSSRAMIRRFLMLFTTPPQRVVHE